MSTDEIRPAATAGTDASPLRKVIAGASIGNAVEWIRGNQPRVRADTAGDSGASFGHR